MPSRIGYSLPPVDQRPQQYNRVEIADSKGAIPLGDDEALKKIGSDQNKTRVVTQTREVLDDRFPTESGVDRFRGNTEGRALDSSAASESLAKLPQRVQAFSPLSARSGDISSLSAAESAAIGLTRPNSEGLGTRDDETQETRVSSASSLGTNIPSTPAINGSGEIKARFDEIQEQFERRANDEFDPLRLGGPESERASQDRADVQRTEDRVNDDLRVERKGRDEAYLSRQRDSVRQRDVITTRNAEQSQIEEAQAEEIRVDPSSAPDANEIAIASASDRPQSNAEAPSPREPGEPKNAQGEPLSSEEQREIERLRRRDQEVRTHEQAHAAAGGAHIRGGVQLSYTTGPDGQRYATDGEVNIDLSAANTPDQTIAKMRQVRSAALAPANPSSADRSVAALASRRELSARAEASAEDREKRATQAEQVAGDPAKRAEETREVEVERAGSAEQRESADNIAGAQSVIPDPSFGTRTTGVDQQSLDYGYGSGYALSSPAETSRPVGGTPISSDIKQSPEESSSPRVEGDKVRSSEVMELAIERGW